MFLGGGRKPENTLLQSNSWNRLMWNFFWRLTMNRMTKRTLKTRCRQPILGGSWSPTGLVMRTRRKMRRTMTFQCREGQIIMSSSLLQVRKGSAFNLLLTLKYVSCCGATFEIMLSHRGINTMPVWDYFSHQTLLWAVSLLKKKKKNTPGRLLFLVHSWMWFGGAFWWVNMMMWFPFCNMQIIHDSNTLWHDV